MQITQMKFRFCLAVQCLFLAFLLIMSGVRRRDNALASRLAPGILRFHVLANSDSKEDQALKLEVKDLLLAEISHDFSGKSPSKESLCRYILEHKDALENTAAKYLREKDSPYPVEIRLEACEFPERTYGDMTFPAGTYDSVRVLIGAGEGKNFWCVLYPSLCYLDSIHAVVPEESKETLKNLLPEEDYEALLSSARTGSVNLKIRCKLAELFFHRETPCDSSV